ncbi:FHA domain-containing protein [Kitasatospora sp. NPDC049285]|uniref:FHA domain-containing protein n=1 Tax=Kitasatospora sp. NPDC049285 TaxID=3157096 RepID=UPI00342C0B91
MAALRYRCPVGEDDCPVGDEPGYCPEHPFERLEAYQPRTAPAAADPAGPTDSQPTRKVVQQPAAPPRLALVFAGAMLPLHPGRSLAVGRDDPDCAAVPGLAGLDQLSRHHARLRWIDGVLHVEDLASTNGTFLDGRPVEGPTPVGPGCRLRFALDLDVQLIEIDEFGSPR